MSKKMEWEYCAVNAFGWAYADDMLEAMDKLWKEYSNAVGGYTYERAKKTCLRVYKFPKGNRPRFQYYCPIWDGKKSVKYWVVYDNMSEYPPDTFPKAFKS